MRTADSVRDRGRALDWPLVGGAMMRRLAMRTTSLPLNFFSSSRTRRDWILWNDFSSLYGTCRPRPRRTVQSHVEKAQMRSNGSAATEMGRDVKDKQRPNEIEYERVQALMCPERRLAAVQQRASQMLLAASIGRL